MNRHKSDNESLKLGFGATGAWGQPWFNRQEAIALIHYAYDHGVRHFDSAGFYANGEAEQRLGEALRGRDDVIISTKVGTKYRPFGRYTKDFSPQSLREDIYASLKRLGREQVSICYLHGPEDWIVSQSQCVFEDLKRNGDILASGVCGHEEVLRLAVREEKTDVIMGRYNLFDRSYGNCFKEAQQKDILTVAISPLAQALYQKDFMRPKNLTDLWAIMRALVKNRSELKNIRGARVEELHHFNGISAPELCLGYVIDQEFVDIVLTNTTKMDHLAQSIYVTQNGGLSEVNRSQLSEFMVKLTI